MTPAVAASVTCGRSFCDVRLQVLLKMDLTAGHAHSSDRYRYLRELAFEYAFLLEKLQTREPGAVEATSVQSTA